MNTAMKSFFGLCIFGMSVSSNAIVDLEAFKVKGDQSAAAKRCLRAVDYDFCNKELNYAYNKNLITKGAYDYGKQSGFYPVIDRNNEIGAVCKCGCFESNTEISTYNGMVLAKDINKDMQLESLTSDASLSNLETNYKNIKYITEGEEIPDLFVFEFDNGAVLKLTQNHGVLLSTGMMTSAKEVVMSDKMISSEGEELGIVSITREPTSDKVYNFEVVGSRKINHIISAEGVLIGDLSWQNQYAQDLNSILIRK